MGLRVGRRIQRRSNVANSNDRTTRQGAHANNATGFSRPKDLHQDLSFTGEGVRLCWTNTRNDESTD
jgi:hypothetical protein